MELFELLSIPAIIALVEAMKATTYVEDRFVPLVALASGLILGLLTGDVLTGLVLGLAASGTYSQVKKLRGK